MTSRLISTRETTFFALARAQIAELEALMLGVPEDIGSIGLRWLESVRDGIGRTGECLNDYEKTFAIRTPRSGSAPES